MNAAEAKQLIEQLNTHSGKEMRPFNAPVKGFIIVPRDQAAYELMYTKMYEKNIPFTEAIQPFQGDVTILVYFDGQAAPGSLRHCSYDHFLASNNLNTYQVAV